MFGESILWIHKHDLLVGIMQLSRQIAIAGIEECVALRREHVEGYLAANRALVAGDCLIGSALQEPTTRRNIVIALPVARHAHRATADET